MGYEIGSKLRKYRLEKRLSQKEFSKQIGVGNSRVSNWEQGINRPDVDLLAKICKVLDVSPSELLDVRLDENEFSGREKRLVMQYRERVEFQKAVDLLLNMEN